MASSLRASSKAVRRQAALLRSCRGTERAPSSARMAVAALSKSLSSGFNHRYHHLHSASSSSGPPRLGRESRAGRFPGTLEKKLTSECPAGALLRCRVFLCMCLLQKQCMGWCYHVPKFSTMSHCKCYVAYL